MEKMFIEGNQMHNFMSSSGSRTVINYGSGSGSDFLTSYGSGSTSQKVTVPTVPVPVLVPVPQHWNLLYTTCEKEGREKFKTNSIEKLGLARMDTVQHWIGQART
jgi:hypothetical protein